jgi:anti-sigma factor RsiW
MTDHISEERLNDWLDGNIERHQQREIEEHVASCAACAAEADRLRRVIDRVRDLPKTIAVPPGVWRAVESRMPEKRAKPGIVAWLGRNPLPVAASIAALLLGGALLIAALKGRAVPPSIPVHEAGDASRAAAIRDLARAEKEFDAAETRLQALLEANRAALPPDAAAALDSSLASLDLATSRIRMASRESPEQPRLARQVRQIHQQKLALLERAIRISRPGM